MSALFFDSSGLIKRYAQETGTNWIFSVDLNTAATAEGLTVDNPNNHQPLKFRRSIRRFSD